LISYAERGLLGVPEQMFEKIFQPKSGGVKAKMKTKQLFVSALVAAALVAFVVIQISPAFAVDARTDFDSDSMIAGSPPYAAYVYHEILAYYPAEDPEHMHDFYSCADFHAWRGSDNPDITISGDFVVRFWAEGYNRPTQSYASNEVTGYLGCWESHNVYGIACTYISYGGQLYYLTSSTGVTSHL